MVKRTLVACFVIVSGTVGIAQVSLLPSPEPSVSAQPGTNIVCGTRVFRADPKVDPKIARPVPRGTFTLKVVEPPVCRDTFPAAVVELKQRLPQFLGPKR